ncbi:MAG: hypothetical protein KF753_02645 [Caldilineaceae bacterium]|nr:hypothetical protein [Caldilineaceae bacterium]
MSTVTVEEVTQRLRGLSPSQLSLVDDFLETLIGRSRTFGEKSSPLEERPISQIEELRLDFWPADETVDDFLHAREVWRSDDLRIEAERAL